MKKHFSIEFSRLITEVRISASVFIHRFTLIGKIIFVFPFISALLLQSAAWAGWPQPARLELWDDLDEVVAAGYNNLTNQALLYPPTVLTGWQVIAPSGRTGELSSVTLSRSAPAMLSADEINAALSMVPPSAPPKTASFDIGLAPTLSAGSIDRIAELARALDYNWLNCYSFVRDNILFVPYADIVRGPVRTLIDREGNSADQSFLLFALLRASGYDATIFYDPYFHVAFTDSATGYDAANWLGISVSGTPAEIQQRIFNILDRASLHPAFDLGETPDESYVAFDHFFVGVALTAGSYTLLDPSFKPQRVNTPDPLLISAMGAIVLTCWPKPQER
ncbi:MAG: hypothetical protein PHO37_10055 [Kiritimatiellae bacterium]|nr:hypothetical protein [Kiritimatiellia bacterium]